MNRSPLPVAVIAALAALAIQTFAAEPVENAGTVPKPGNDRGWVIRLEALFLAVPQNDYIDLLPKLRERAVGEATVSGLLDAVKQGKAKLFGCPVLHLRNGERSVSETIMEERYPSDWELEGQTPQEIRTKPKGPSGPLPTTFETRNAGITVEAEANVEHDGRVIRIRMIPQHVTLVEFKEFGMRTGGFAPIEQPRFFTTKIQDSIVVRNGEWVLVGAHRTAIMEGHIELVLVRADATDMSKEGG